MDRNVKKIVYLALLTALTILATMFLKIPSGIGGYMNLGDAVILAGGAVMGPWMALPAAIGSALADLLLGYMSYIPATLIIKGLMGLLSGRYLFSRHDRKRILVIMALCEVLMIAGYFLFELAAFGVGYAVASILPNVLQATLSLIAAAALMPFFDRIKSSIR